MFALFSVPAGVPSVTLPFYMAGTLLCFYVSYSTFAVPYMAMPMEMSDDHGVRTSLMSYRTGFLAIAGIAGMTLAPFLLSRNGGQRPAFAIMGGVMGAVICGSMLTAFFSTKSARIVPPMLRHGRENTLGVLMTPSFAALLASKGCLLLGTA